MRQREAGGPADLDLVSRAVGPLPLKVVQPETASNAETSATRIFMPTTGFLELEPAMDAPGAASSEK